MQTKAAVLHGAGQDWTIEQVELGDPVAGEVQVRLTATGLCHSDHHVRTGQSPAPMPIIGGHEAAGVITKVGPGVTDLEVGDHVVTAFIPACGECRWCVQGQDNLCDASAHLANGRAIADDTYRVTLDGTGITQMCLLGTFSPYITVHQVSVVKIDRGIPLHLAALLGCGVATGWGSAAEIGGTQDGDTVVVVGAGGVGINAVQGARAAGARHVVAIDPVDFKRDMATRLGATHTFDSIDSARPILTELTGGQLATTVILAQGELRGSDIQPAISITGKAGQVVVAGLGDMMATDVTLSLYELTCLQKRLQGAIFGGTGPRRLIPTLVREYQAGRLNLEDLVTRTYRLEEINEAYDDMVAGRTVRGIIAFDDRDY